MPSPRDVLAQNRADALDLVNKVGLRRTRQILLEAERDLARRLMQLDFQGASTFTREQMRTTMLQIQKILSDLNWQMTTTLVNTGGQASDRATESLVRYLTNVEASFKGVGSTGLDLDTAAMFEAANVGARASILRRLGVSGEKKPGSPKEEHPAKDGILSRYGMNTIGFFEETLQKGIVARKPWNEMKAEIIGGSPFLQQAPGHWAERIVRTELMGAYNRASWEANREANGQLGDMVKILSATFDDRTAADSYAVHGQIRRPDEAFESWFGLYQHPPNRPNDREIVVPHRVSWPIPPYLKWKEEAEIAERWAKEKRKGAVPPRPRMTTIDVAEFGKTREPRMRDTERRPKPPRVPPEE